MYRLDVLGRNWHTIALGQKAALENYGYSHLRPDGPYQAYRVRKARKSDLQALKDGLFHLVQEGLYLFYQVAPR